MSKPDAATPEGFYRYLDDAGNIHIVDDLASIPAKFRAAAEKVDARAPRDLFAFVDDDGQTLIADSLEAIPAKYRDIAKKVSVDDAQKAVKALEKKVLAAKNEGLVGAKKVQREVGDVVPFVKDLDIPSVMFGFALALVTGLVLSIFRRTGRTLAKIGMFILVVAFVAGAYFAWIRRVAGLGDQKLASPTAMIDDAKKAARQMEDRLQQQQKILEQVERLER